MKINLSKTEINELKHIYENQPVDDGNTLGGSSKRALREKGLIQTVEGFNITTPQGNKVYHQLF